MKQYSYIFLKPGLIPEQVAIQSAHVAMVLADALTRNKVEYDSTELNYVMTPLSITIDELRGYLYDLSIDFVSFKDYEYTFFDGKLTQSNEMVYTAVMTFPIDEDRRRWLRMLPLYRVKK